MVPTSASLSPPPSESGLDMNDVAFEGFAQPIKVRLAYGSLPTVEIAAIAMNAILPHRHELHNRFLGRLIK